MAITGCQLRNVTACPAGQRVPDGVRPPAGWLCSLVLHAGARLHLREAWASEPAGSQSAARWSLCALSPAA